MDKRKIGNSWYLIVVEDMTDEKYDVFGNHLSGGVKPGGEVEVWTTPWTIVYTVKPVLGGHRIKRTPSVKRH